MNEEKKDRELSEIVKDMADLLDRMIEREIERKKEKEEKEKTQI